MIGINSLNESFTGFGDTSNEELENKEKLLQNEIKELKDSRADDFNKRSQILKHKINDENSLGYHESSSKSFPGFEETSGEEFEHKMKLLRSEITKTKKRIESYGFEEEDYYPELNLQIRPSQKSTQKIDSNQKEEYDSRRCSQASLTPKANILQEIDGNENYNKVASSLAINENQTFVPHMKSFGEAPTWTYKPLSPSTDKEGTEDLHNEVFAKRHEGPELQEQKIKREYAKEMRKVEKCRKLKETYEKKTTK